ncbi:MAG: hypothetical protein O3B68_22280, partial [Planctomycetota bacterium]|nr:hypothetical protein [Planctomycetota bacterium]
HEHLLGCGGWGFGVLRKPCWKHCKRPVRTIAPGWLAGDEEASSSLEYAIKNAMTASYQPRVVEAELRLRLASAAILLSRAN